MISDFEQYSPKISDSVYIDALATVIGNVDIGAESSIWPQAVIRGDVHQITIGSRSNIQDGAVLHVSHDSEYLPGGAPLVVEDDVTIGHNVSLHGCLIQSRCLIGIGSIVLDGAVIESDIILAAGSLVPPGKRLEAGYLWKGSPVSKARPLSEKEKTYIAYSAQHYVRLSARHQR